MKLKHKSIRLLPFPVQLIYICCPSKKQAAEYLFKKLGITQLVNEWTSNDSAGQTTMIKNSSTIVIWVREKYIPLIVHEVIHAINQAEQMVGQFYFNNCDETQAYLSEYIMREILDLKELTND